MRLGSIGAQLGAQINEFSTDGTLSQNSNEKVPTQAAVKTYVDTTRNTLINADAAGLLMAHNHTTLGLATERSQTQTDITNLTNSTNTNLALNRTDSQSRTFFVGLS